MLRRLILLVALALGAMACGSATDTAIVDGESAGANAGASGQAADDGIERCDPLAALPTAEPEFYRDAPRYVGNEQPTDEVRNWAATQPGFQAVWVDRDHNGWVTVGFDRDIAERQQDLLSEFPDDGVVAVLVDWDLAELRRLQDEVTQHLVDAGVESFAAGASMQHGLVQLSFGVLTNDIMSALAPYAGQPICVEGAEPVDTPPDGPQADVGKGWRLLTIEGSARGQVNGEEPAPAAGPPPTPGGIILERRVELATTDQQLAAMWEANSVPLLGAEQPPVDFEAEVVVLVGDIESGSCPILFRGLQFPEPQRLVLDQGVANTSVVCTDDANSVVYAIAIQREALPTGSFTISGPADLWVAVDLRVAASAVADSATLAVPLTAAAPESPEPTAAPVPQAFQPDPRPTAPLGPDAQLPQSPVSPAAFPLVLEPGFPSTYDLPSGCFYSLGPINGFVWQIQGSNGDMPDEWLMQSDDQGQLRADMLLAAGDSGAEPSLEVTIGGIAQTYEIVDGALPGC